MLSMNDPPAPLVVSRLDISKGSALREGGHCSWSYSTTGPRPPRGRATLSLEVAADKDIALLAENVSASKRTYKHSNPPGAPTNGVGGSFIRCLLARTALTPISFAGVLSLPSLYAEHEQSTDSVGGTHLGNLSSSINVTESSSRLSA
jgi:hypothetical protein